MLGEHRILVALGNAAKREIVKSDELLEGRGSRIQSPVTSTGAQPVSPTWHPKQRAVVGAKKGAGKYGHKAKK